MQRRVLVLRPHADTIGGVEHYYNVLALEAFDPRFEYFFVTQPDRGTGLTIAARLARLYVQFWRTLRTREYALVVLNPSLNRNSFFRDALFCVLARVQRCSVLTFFRGWSEEMERWIERHWLPRAIFRASFAQGQDFVVLGKTFRTRLLRLGCSPRARYHLASTVADDSFLSDLDLEHRLSRNPPLRILFLSRLIPAKGALLALQAVSLARSWLPEIPLHLTIAGDGPDLPLLRAAADLDNVEFTGAVTGEAKRRLLLESDIFLFPTSHGEGLPNVVLEAMLYGMPILSRPVGGLPDVIEQGVNGFLTDTLDPVVFARWLVQLARDRELRHRISHANHCKALASFTRDQVRAHFVRIVEDSILR